MGATVEFRLEGEDLREVGVAGEGNEFLEYVPENTILNLIFSR